MQAQTTKRTIVDIDTRRKVIMATKARKPSDVARTPHEVFARHMLKSIMGWGNREQAPDSIKAVSRDIAKTLNKEMLDKSKAIIARKEAE